MYVPVYVPVLIFGFYRKNPYIRGIYENVRIMSAKLIGFTAFALLSGGVLFCSCGGNSSAFITNLRNFSADKEITEVEYASLKGFLQRTPKGFDVGGTHISTEADLVSYLHSQGITSSAKALAVMPDVTFDSLQVYLENSASMKGYSNAGNPNFTAPVIALFNVGDPDTQIVTGYVGASASGEAALSPVERSKFESNLANGRIATAVAEGNDAGIAAGAILFIVALCIFGCDLVEKFFDQRVRDVLGALFVSALALVERLDLLQVVQLAHDAAACGELFGTVFHDGHGNFAFLFGADALFDDFGPFDGVVIAVDGGGDDLFDIRAQFFCARFGRLYFSVPENSSLRMTSSRDFLPRLRTLSISSSVFLVRSSMVWMFARLRQL